MTREELGAALREHAYLEGDFLLRSGRRSKYYLDKYRFETQPEVLRELGAQIVALVRKHEPESTRLAAPELGAVTLAAAASLESGIPFLIVRGSAKTYGTMNRIEGIFEPGDRVCLIEDVVTTAGALVETVHALREAGLEVRTAVCVVDREQGGGKALARQSVELLALFRATELLGDPKIAANPHG